MTSAFLHSRRWTLIGFHVSLPFFMVRSMRELQSADHSQSP